jgi:sugar lactone lactonase YvrE
MRRSFVLVLALAAAAVAISQATGGSPQHGAGRFAQLGQTASWRTVLTSPLGLEGLTADAAGNLYTTLRDSAPDPCRVVRVSPANTDPTGGFTTVALVPQPCQPSGLAFGPDRALYITGSGAGRDEIARVVPNASAPPTATIYATGVAQANGIAFDRDGALWATDGSVGAGIVWKIAPGGGAGVEAFRIPAMHNEQGVGRAVDSLPPDREQKIVANGIAFTSNGDILVADTARGAVWRVGVHGHGSLDTRENCDSTYPSDTLCLDEVLVEHPYLEGLDGIVLDRAGDIWGAANERNAIVVVARDGTVQEFFRNPVGADGLRNAGPLETPTSPVFAGHTLCVAQSDGARRDNFPNGPGEVSGGGKISCVDGKIEP